MPRRISRSTREKMLREQCGCCAYCGARITLETRFGRRRTYATIDHIVPLSLGGRRYRRSNLAMACLRCNRLKGDLPLIVFMAQFG